MCSQMMKVSVKMRKKAYTREHKKLYKKVLKQLSRRAIQQEKEKKKIIERLSKYCAKWVLDDTPSIRMKIQGNGL